VLKITTTNVQGERKLVVEGKLTEPWAAELKRVWQDMRKVDDDREVVVDLGSVTVIDPQGERVLLEMMRGGVRFDCRGILNKHVLKQISRRCKDEPSRDIN
jgi:hypothetical protein